MHSINLDYSINCNRTAPHLYYHNTICSLSSHPKITPLKNSSHPTTPFNSKHCYSSSPTSLQTLSYFIRPKIEGIRSLLIFTTDKPQQYHLTKRMGAEHEPVKYSKQQLKNTHPYLQQAWIVREEKRSYLQKSFPIEEKHYNQWRSRVSKAAGYPNSQFSFLPVDMGYVPENQECSKTGYTLVNYPEFPYLLSDQIKSRQKENKIFREGQLYYLLYALTAVKIDAKQRGEVVGDIKPENVFISRDQNIKIGLLESFPFQSTNYAKFTSPTQPSHNVLLAPEDLKLATQKQLDNSANTKSEVFSIGATVLSAGILSDLTQVYDYPNRAFLNQKHSAMTIRWLEQSHYSEIFKSIVLNLLNPDAEKRISIEQLWKFLNKYSSSILAKEQFIVVNPPESLEVGVSIIRSKVH